MVELGFEHIFEVECLDDGGVVVGIIEGAEWRGRCTKSWKTLGLRVEDCRYGFGGLVEVINAEGRG